MASLRASSASRAAASRSGPQKRAMISRLVWPKVEANSSSVISRPCSRRHEDPAAQVRLVGVDEDAVDVEDHRGGRRGAFAPCVPDPRAPMQSGCSQRGLSGLAGPV